MNEILEKYQKEAIPLLMKKFGYSNKLAVPRMECIIVSMGLGKLSKDTKAIEKVMADLAQITGQKPALRKARKSIAGFNLRKGEPIGCLVTLRGRQMFEFFNRLVNFALPQVRDFQGLSPNSFDERGNYSFGLEEQVIFPEIDYNKVSQIHGMNITIKVKGKVKGESGVLLKELGLPLQQGDGEKISNSKE